MIGLPKGDKGLKSFEPICSTTAQAQAEPQKLSILNYVTTILYYTYRSLL